MIMNACAGGELSPTKQTLGKLEFDLHFDTDTKMFIRTNCEATFFVFFPCSVVFQVWFVWFCFFFLNIFILMFWFRLKENKQNYLNRLFVWVFF